MWDSSVIILLLPAITRGFGDNQDAPYLGKYSQGSLHDVHATVVVSITFTTTVFTFKHPLSLSSCFVSYMAVMACLRSVCLAHFYHLYANPFCFVFNVLNQPMIWKVIDQSAYSPSSFDSLPYSF